MKHIVLTLAIACLALSSTARADVWGRVIPNTSVARMQEKVEPAPDLNEKSAVQAPGPVIQSDGYPFADRCCANKSTCCDGIWDGYKSSCGCGIGRGIFAHGHRCGGLFHGHGCNSCSAPVSNGCSAPISNGCGCAGGCGNFNSFAGGAIYGGCGCGTGRGLGWHGCGLHSLAGCGKHHLHNLRRLCGFGCDTGCGESIGCNSCNGKSHTNEVIDGKNMLPPTPPGEPTPMLDKPQDAPPNPEKSAYRPTFPNSSRRPSLGF